MGSLATCLAQAATQPAPPGPNLLVQLFPLILIGLVFYLLLFRPQRRERDRHQKLIGALKKNDRVITIGGIIGTVVTVKGDEVTLKVDESTNTKVTFVRSAIKSVLSSTAAEEKTS